MAELTPPPELVKQWLAEFYGPESMPGMAPGEMVLHVAAVAAHWGYEQRAANNEDELQKARDEELEACCEWLKKGWIPPGISSDLRTARRPPSLKEQALEALKHAEEGWRPVPADCEIIRRALESLPD